MENVADALKIAGAVLLFVMALTVAMFSLSGARAASEAIIYTKDEKNYYSYVDQSDYVENGKFKTSREVTMDAIIPTLYRYYTEQYRVEFWKNKNEKLVLYTVTNTPNTFTWRQNHTDEEERINYLDLDDEMERNEPWQGSRENTKSFVDMLINGPEIKIKRPDGSELATAYTDAPLNRYKDSNRYKFREELGEYTYENNTEEGNNSALSDSIESHKQKKRVIRYTLVQ